MNEINKYEEENGFDALLRACAEAVNDEFTGLLQQYVREEKKNHAGTLDDRDFTIQVNKLRRSLAFFYDRLDKTRRDQLLAYLSNGKTGRSTTGIRKLLFVEAAPPDFDPLLTTAEFQSINDKLANCDHRDELVVINPLMAAGLVDFVARVNKDKPAIIHFAGHGCTQGLYFREGDTAHAMVEKERLERIFSTFEEAVECVVLNACYSSEQAETISRKVDFVIGMNCFIRDTAARNFADTFYRLLGTNMNYAQSFRQAILVLSKEDGQTAELWEKGIKTQSV